MFFRWITCGRPTQEEIVVRNLEPGKEYNFRIKAVNNEGESDPLEAEKSVKLLGKPGKPEGPLTVSDVYEEGCTLGWNPPKEDGGLPIQRYIVEKRNHPNGVWTLAGKTPADQTNLEVFGLEPGQKYDFRVKAVNEAGDSEPLEGDHPVLAKNPFNKPAPPGTPKIEDFDKNWVELTWEPPFSDGGSRILGYTVEYKDPTDPKWLIANATLIKGTTFKVTGLIEGREYEFRVKAKNAAGFSKPSPPSGLHKMRSKYAVPTPPRNLSVTKVGKTYVDLRWDQPKSDGGNKITGYLVERKEMNSTYWIKVNEYGCLDCQYTVLNLTEDNEYEFRVAAINSAGKSDYCTTINKVRVSESFGGSKPEFVRRLFNRNTNLKSQVVLECEALGKPIPSARWFKNGREFYPSERVKAVDNGDGIYKLIFNEVLDNDEADYTCEVYNSLGSDRCTASLNIAAPPQILKCPKDVYFPEHDSGKIKIYFSGSSPFDVTLFKNGIEVDQNEHLKITVFDEYVIIFIREVLKNDEGQYKINVKNDSGQTSASFNLFVTGLPGPPQGPLEVSEISRNSATLSWKPPKYDGGCKIAHYIVERKETTHNQWVTATSYCKETFFTAQGLTEGGEYLFRVFAVNENGQSTPLEGENPIIAKLPFDPPSAPGIPQVTEVGGDFVNLSWDKPTSDGGASIQGYFIEKREAGTTTWQRVNNVPTRATQYNIANLIEDRQYEFRVFAVNEAGLSPPSSNSNSVKIKDPQAAVPPEFTVPLRKVMAIENKTVELTCTVRGFPKPTITWYKGARDIYENAKFTMTQDEDTYTLTIYNVYGEDEDEYACKATNRGGTRTSRAELIIKTAPHLNVPPRFRNVAFFDRGENVNIKIPFTGNPKPTITWYKDDEEIEKGAHFDVITKDRHAILVIRDVSKIDNGPYKIVAKNELGTDSAVINVQISDRPDPPRFPIIENIADETVTISWKPPVWDGGSQITNYVIEKREPNMASWIKCGNTRFLLHQVTGLNPDKEYEFRIFAENVYGRSEPSQVTQKIRTKPSGKEKEKKKGWYIDEKGKKIRGKGEPVSNYDIFVHDNERVIPQPVDIKTSSVYDYYDILEEIGTGAFGVVHRCREKKSGNIFAIKFIPVSHPLEKAIIRKEIDIMNQLHHQKLIRLHDAFEDDDEMVLVYEFMSGGELFERITDEDYHMTEAEVVNYMRQICDAVKHMHEKNIIHLDIKPENIMCQTKTSNKVKLIDFGLANKLDPNEIVKISTGTAEFAAPEIVEREPVGFYTDMWAVGVLAYVLLSGLSPFAGEDDVETLKNVKACDWSFDQEAFKNVSEEGKDFISRLLTKNKQKRMTAHECCEHPWLKKDNSELPTVPIPNKKYIKIRDRIRAKYAPYWMSAKVPIGHIANYSSLRKLQDEKYKMLELYFDRREAAPRFVIRPQSTFAYEGQAAKFTCRVIATAPATITWYRDNAELKQSVKYMKRYMENDYTFVLNRCKLEDRGEYIIRAENHYGFREEPVFLNVHPLPKELPKVKMDEPIRRRREQLPALYEEPKDCAPYFTFLLRPRVIQAGLGVKLLCCCTAKPIPEITWFKDHKELSKYDYTMTHADGVMTLEILSCKLDDAGRYTCKASNSLGEACTTCAVSIEGMHQLK